LVVHSESLHALISETGGKDFAVACAGNMGLERLRGTVAEIKIW
jgi:hypothetical protein